MIQQPDSIHRDQTVAEPAALQEANALGGHADSTVTEVYSTKTSHWPVKVDSLLRPDDGKELEVESAELPTYYKDSYFAKDSLLHAELAAGRYGVAGDPVPYTVHNDSYLTMTLFISTLMLLYCLKRLTRFFLRHFKSFFRTPRLTNDSGRRQTPERRYLVVAGIHTAVILALEFYFFTKLEISDTYITYSEYTLMGIYFGAMLALFVFEYLLSSSVNSMFFTPLERQQWSSVKLASNVTSGVLLTPMLLLVAYFGLSIENSLIYTLGVIVFIKILLFCKAFLIFFSKRRAYVQIFLYFCTLEVIPPLLLWGILVTVANHLKVNY